MLISPGSAQANLRKTNKQTKAVQRWTIPTPRVTSLRCAKQSALTFYWRGRLHNRWRLWSQATGCEVDWRSGDPKHTHTHACARIHTKGFFNIWRKNFNCVNTKITSLVHFLKTVHLRNRTLDHIFIQSLLRTFCRTVYGVIFKTLNILVYNRHRRRSWCHFLQFRSPDC